MLVFASDDRDDASIDKDLLLSLINKHLHVDALATEATERPVNGDVRVDIHWQPVDDVSDVSAPAAIRVQDSLDASTATATTHRCGKETRAGRPCQNKTRSPLGCWRHRNVDVDYHAVNAVVLE